MRVDMDHIFVKSKSELFEINPLAPANGGQLLVEAHRHNFYHIMMVKNGVGTHQIDFKNYRIEANTLFFISPGQVHSLEINEEVEGYVISFRTEFFLMHEREKTLMDFPFFHSISNAPVVYLTEKQEELQLLWDEIYREHCSERKDRMDVIRVLMELMLLKASRQYKWLASEENAPAYLSFQLRKLDTLIDQHYKKFKLLSDYAELMYLSPKQLNSLCKKGLHKTVSKLIHERTVTEAKRLLLFTHQTIGEIAFELGFSDKSYFMRFFKKHTGYTAEAFRNNKAFQ